MIVNIGVPQNSIDHAFPHSSGKQPREGAPFCVFPTLLSTTGWVFVLRSVSRIQLIRTKRKTTQGKKIAARTIRAMGPENGARDVRLIPERGEYDELTFPTPETNIAKRPSGSAE